MSIDHNGDQIAALMRPYHIRLLELAAADADNVLGIDASFDLESAEVQDVLDLLATKVRSVAETTKEDIRRLTGQGAEQGWSPAHLADEIAKLGEIASKSRAMLISRTESALGYNHGTILRYEQSGQVSGVEVLDGTNDEICAAANGQTWTLDEARDSPIGHPNCVRAFVAVLSDTPQDEPQDLNTTIREAEDEIREQKYETGIFWSPGGDLLLRKDGVKNAVTFTDEEVAQVRGAYMTHNHPGGHDFPASDPRHVGNSFSPDDVLFASTANLSEIRAITPVHRYRMQAGPGGWDELYLQGVRENGNVRYEWGRAIARGEMPIEQAEAHHWHEVWSRASKAVNALYEQVED